MLYRVHASHTAKALNRPYRRSCALISLRETRLGSAFVAEYTHRYSITICEKVKSAHKDCLSVSVHVSLGRVRYRMSPQMARRSQPCQREATSTAISVGHGHSSASSGLSGPLPRLSIGTSAQCLLYRLCTCIVPARGLNGARLRQVDKTRTGNISDYNLLGTVTSIQLVRPTPRIMRPPLRAFDDHS